MSTPQAQATVPSVPVSPEDVLSTLHTKSSKLWQYLSCLTDVESQGLRRFVSSQMENGADSPLHLEYDQPSQGVSSAIRVVDISEDHQQRCVGNLTNDEISNLSRNRAPGNTFLSSLRTSSETTRTRLILIDKDNTGPNTHWLRLLLSHAMLIELDMQPSDAALTMFFDI